MKNLRNLLTITKKNVINKYSTFVISNNWFVDLVHFKNNPFGEGESLLWHLYPNQNYIMKYWTYFFAVNHYCKVLCWWFFPTFFATSFCFTHCYSKVTVLYHTSGTFCFIVTIDCLLLEHFSNSSLINLIP